MTDSLWLLTITAASIGCLHTIIGPDHYIPFIMMSRAQNWTRGKTMFITFLCGIGHVLSSVFLGIIGIAFGVALAHLQLIESVRGNIASWVLIAFGIIYCIWGLKDAYNKGSHSHPHQHEDGTVHEHAHSHLLHKRHAHGVSAKGVMTTWALFTIFVLGPCEPLIPLLMYPAAAQSFTGILMVSTVFGIVTIATMMVMVWIVTAGFERLRLKSVERFTHALAGGAIAVTGLVIQVFGL
jgi:nickel/cobalt transporter (NicO) family protein